MLRWLERRRKGAPGGRWAEFYAAVADAEAGDRRLAALKDAADRLNDPMQAWAWLERHEFAEPEPRRVPLSD